MAGFGCPLRVWRCALADWLNLSGTESTRAFLRFKLNGLTFAQAFEAGALYRRMVYEYIIAAIFRGNEAESFFITKPFNFTSTHISTQNQQQQQVTTLKFYCSHNQFFENLTRTSVRFR